ncbi:hypothetical protein ACH47Z_44270 [Streptomyces sp. NPDC020192]|uniref:hypothetical protein n=1 Tax=Streptomyces sp. NPDC020192 TaxID=3365066 RepID=UPI00379B23C3
MPEVLEDSFPKSRAGAPESVIDSWSHNTSGSSFLILVASLTSPSAPAALVLTGFTSGIADVVALTFRDSDPFPSGPHLVNVNTDCTRIELRALAAENDQQTSCTINYTVKWL